MIRSSAKPYEGREPYLFVCYCHKDRHAVLPFIERMARDGYRIWYDEGIIPGSEWNETIASHISRSDLFLVFISKNAVASHYCKLELSYALQKEKAVLSVFLEEAVLTPGLELQLSANQCIFINEYEDIDKCLHFVLHISEFRSCLGTPNTTIITRVPSFYDDEEFLNEDHLVNISDMWFGLSEKEESPEFWLLRESTGEEIVLDCDSIYIGRVASSTQNCYVIPDNNKISREHFTVIKLDGCYHVFDGGSERASSNGTFLNGVKLLPDESRQLYNGDEIRAYTETFIFFDKTSATSLEDITQLERTELDG